MIFTQEPQYFEPSSNWFVLTGRRVLMICRGTGRALLMIMAAAWYLPYAFSRRNRAVVVEQMFIAGVKSLGVITIVGLFIGMILAFQTGFELRRFGQEDSIGTMVTVVMLREMGPFMTALIIASSVGAAMAAQIATMTVSEEVAALEVMSINPLRFIVMPRLVALMIMVPLLTVYTNAMGILGGAIVGYTQLGIGIPAYFEDCWHYASNRDLYVGLIKAMVFGVIIAATACHQGFVAQNGAVGVGRATRQTVVISFLVTLMTGYFLTWAFYG
jgi:phospholipid/cholesterol/gamma-HCH transport system permease protein